MPGNHHHRHRLNRKGHKKQKQKIPNKCKSPNLDEINNENPLHQQQNDNFDLNITYDTNKTITVNESKILQELYGYNENLSKHNQSTNIASSSSNYKPPQCQITITANHSNPNVKNKRYKQKYMKNHEVNEKSRNSKTPNMHLLLTTRSSFDNKTQLDVSPSITSTKYKKNKTNDLMLKTPNDSRYVIYTPYSKKRPLNSPTDQTTIADEHDFTSTNVTKSFNTSWTITSQAKRSRRAGHITAPDIKICCTPKRLFHDQQPPTSTPIAYIDPSVKNQITNGGYGDQRLMPPSAIAASSVISQTIEKCNKLTFTNISTHSIAEYNEQVKITMSLYSNNGHKSQEIVPDDFQTKCSRRFSWFNSISSSLHNFVTNMKKLLIQDWVSNMLRSSYNNVLIMNAMMDFVIKKWATITLKRHTSSNLGSSPQINNNTSTQHTRHNPIMAGIGQHADCYAQIQIMQRTIRDLTTIAEEQNKKIENLTNEVMQLKIKSTTAATTTFNGLVFGSGCNNCGVGSSSSSMIPAPPPPPCAPPIPPPPPPPLPPLSLIKPMGNTLLREKKTGSRQLQQRSSSIGTDRPAITLEDILSVKLKKTKPAKQSEPEPIKITNTSILTKTKLKQVRLRAKSRVRSRGASPAQQFFDNCKSGTNSLLELLENSGRNIQVQNLMTAANQNQSSLN